MSSFNVTTTPSEIYLGNQNSDVTLINDGPNTIYLDNIPGVSPLNGFVLPPTGQMTWNAREPLWVVTATGQARLFSSITGNLSITARGHFWKLLDRTTNNIPTAAVTVQAETAFCNSLLIRIDFINASSHFDNFLLQMEWSDFLGNVLKAETLNFNCTDISGTAALVTVPVKGAMVAFNIFPPDAAATITAVTTYGTDQTLPFRAWAEGMSAYINGFVANERNNAIYISHFTPQAGGAGGTIMLPCLGTHIQTTLRFENAVTTAGELFLIPVGLPGVIFQHISIPVLGTPAVYVSDADIPEGLALEYFFTPAPVSTPQTVSLSVVYSN